MGKDAGCPPGCVTEAPCPPGCVKSGEIKVTGPTAEITGPKAQVTAPDVEVKGPKVDAKAPDVEVKGPKVDVKGPDVDVKGPKVDVKGPDVDIKMKGSARAKGEGELCRCDKEWDDNFVGRVRNYMAPRRFWYIFKSDSCLRESRDIMKQCLQKRPFFDKCQDEVFTAKHIFDSTYNIDTGEKICTPVRKAWNVPMDGIIMGLMMTFYRSIPGIILGQFAQQTYTSGFDYCNRKCEHQATEICVSHYKLAYAVGTATSIMAAIGLGSFIKKHHHPVIGRLVPFAGVAAATLIYIPFLNVNTLRDGWPCRTEKCKKTGEPQKIFSVNAAQWALPAETIGKVLMIAPPMVIPPFVMYYLEYKKRLFCKNPWLQAPIQIALCCLSLMLLTPLIRGLYPDWSPMALEELETCLQNEFKDMKKETEDKKAKDSPPPEKPAVTATTKTTESEVSVTVTDKTKSKSDSTSTPKDKDEKTKPEKETSDKEGSTFYIRNRID